MWAYIKLWRNLWHREKNARDCKRLLQTHNQTEKTAKAEKEAKAKSFLTSLLADALPFSGMLVSCVCVLFGVHGCGDYRFRKVAGCFQSTQTCLLMIELHWQPHPKSMPPHKKLNAKLIKFEPINFRILSSCLCFWINWCVNRKQMPFISHTHTLKIGASRDRLSARCEI